MWEEAPHGASSAQKSGNEGRKPMKLKILTVGKPKESFTLSGVSEYRKRIDRHFALDIAFLADPKGLSPGASKEEGSKRILKALEGRDQVILLDEGGPTMDSLSFSAWFYDLLGKTPGRLVFVIGGAFGVTDSVKSRADGLLALSSMTLTHEMALLLLVEQLYRAIAIRMGTGYHH